VIIEPTSHELWNGRPRWIARVVRSRSKTRSPSCPNWYNSVKFTTIYKILR
jgi:hypothetical protein